MKKIFFMVLALVIACGFALAEENTKGNEPRLIAPSPLTTGDNTTVQGNQTAETLPNSSSSVASVDEETQREMQLFVESHKGAVVRMLQLKREILKSSVAGSEIIRMLSARGENTTELEAILDDINILKDEIDEANYTVETFVSLKKELIEDNRDFRKAVAGKLTADDRRHISKIVREDDEIKQTNQEIKSELRKLNAERVKRLLSLIGIKKSSLTKEILNGSIKPAKARRFLVNYYKRAEQQKKAHIREVLKKRFAEEKKLTGKHIQRYRKVALALKEKRIREKIARLEKMKKMGAIKRIKKHLAALDKSEKLGGSAIKLKKKWQMRNATHTVNTTGTVEKHYPKSQGRGAKK